MENTPKSRVKRLRGVCYCSTAMHDRIIEGAHREGRTDSRQLIHLIRQGLDHGYPIRNKATGSILGQKVEGERSAVWFYPEGDLMGKVTTFRERWNLTSDSEAIRVLVYTALHAHLVRS